VDGNVRIQLREDLIEPGAATQDGGLARHDTRLRYGLRRHQFGRQVACAYIFLDRAGDDGLQIIGKGGMRHQESSGGARGSIAVIG
jgi:hypothetical protein